MYPQTTWRSITGRTLTTMMMKIRMKTPKRSKSWSRERDKRIRISRVMNSASTHQQLMPLLSLQETRPWKSPRESPSISRLRR